MKDELSKKLVEVIGAIQNGVGKASDFAVEQLPDIAQQYIAYGRVSETVYFIFFIVFAVVALLIAAKENKDYGIENFPWHVLLGVGGVVSACGAVITLQSVIMVWFAPKIYLIKGLAGLIK